MSTKAKVKEYLDDKQFSKIADLSESTSGVTRYVLSYLYSTDDLLHWRAAEALGVIAKRQYERGLDEGRNIPRRLVWSLAEESGATAYPAPEALGAIVMALPEAFTDFGRIVLSFIGDPVLNRGVLWSARKISELRPDITHSSIQSVIDLLSDRDSTIRGHAAWALGAMKAVEAIKSLKNLENDHSSLLIYDEGDLKETTVSELARRSIEEMSR